MPSFQRYWRAFTQALKMTLRSEKLPPPPQPPLLLWTRQYATLMDALIKTADQNGLDQAGRKQVSLRLDGRQMSLETALMTLRFHAHEEYVSLLRSGVNSHVLNALQASNMNDRYWLARLLETPALQAAVLQTALTRLDAHLADLPIGDGPDK
jgi:hypothetical protein